MISLMFYYLIGFRRNLKDFLLLLMMNQMNLTAFIFPFMLSACGPTFYIEKYLNLYTFILKHLIFHLRIIIYSSINYMTIIRFLDENYANINIYVNFFFINLLGQ